MTPLESLDAFALRDPPQHPVEHWIVRGRAIDDHQPRKIGVYAVCERQIHQDGAHQRIVQGTLSDGQEDTFVIIHDEHQDFFGERQHGTIASLIRIVSDNHSARRRRLPDVCRETFRSECPASNGLPVRAGQYRARTCRTRSD